MISKRELLINEFCFKAKLSNFREFLTSIITEIENSDCKIGCNDIERTSVLRPTENGYLIHIGLIEKEPLHVLWDILHEFGHFQSGHKENHEIEYKREIEAWGFAHLKMMKYAELVPHENNFKLYKEDCVASYRKYFQEKFKEK